MARILAAVALAALFPHPSGASPHPSDSSPSKSSERCDQWEFTESVVVSEDGIEIFARRGGRGETVVVVPGDFLLFDSLCALADRHRVIFYDMRNRGRSSPVPDGERLTLEGDVRDLAAIFREFEVERAALVGYSYLGKMVVAFALEHPERASRIVQIGPVPMDPHRTFPPALEEPPLTSSGAFDEQIRAIRARRAEGLHESDPRAYCELEWELARRGLVGDPANAADFPSRCHLPNEWPTRLVFHMQHDFVGSMLASVVTPAEVASLDLPVLTIHGTRDRNAPYGGGREWAAALPGARLMTMEGMAHAVHREIDLTGVLETFFAGQWPAGVETVEPATDTQRSQLQAWDFARHALALAAPEWTSQGDEVGAPASVLDDAIELRWRGIARPRSQSRTSEAPFEPPFPLRWTVTMGPRGDHLALVEELEWPQFLSRYRSVVTPDEAFDVNLDSGAVTPPFREPRELTARIVRYTPPLLLAEVLRETPGSLRFEGVVEVDGETMHALSAVHRGERLELLLGRDGSLRGWNRIASEPMLGDASETVRFIGSTDESGFRLPSRIVRRLEGVGTLTELDLVSATRTDLEMTLFERPRTPDGDRSGAEPADSAAPAAESAAQPGGLGRGVFLYAVPGNPDYNSLIIERPDHLILVEAPVSAEATRDLLARVTDRFGDKPIRWVVATHHHFDHSAGVPAALAAGATLVTTPGNVEFFRRAVVGPHTASGAIGSPEPPRIRAVDDEWLVPDGSPTVRVLRVEPTDHAAEMLVVHLPEAKLLFQGDLVRFPLPPDEPLRPQVRAVVNAIRSRHLDVERIAGVHGEVGTLAELEARIGD